MHRRRIYLRKGKRAVYAGLFLGVLFGLSACTKPVVQPGVTNSPMPSPTAEVGQTPAPGGPTQSPGITEGPDVSLTDAPSGTPSVTLPLTPALTGEPEVTAGVTPEPGTTPTGEPQVTTDPDGSPVPEPTGQPEYDTLLQAGWQRAEDFFGDKEVFFSGKYDRSELIAAEGRYEYRYTSSSDKKVSFSIIGEERELQQFLDELVRDSLECYVTRERENDYKYLYSDGTYKIEGRVYDCSTEDTVRLMRVETRTTVIEETLTEGHEFYLKDMRAAE